MSDPVVDVGIASFGFAFGEDRDVAATATDYVSDPERVLKWGYHTYHRAPADVHALDLGADAARAALRRLELPAGELDLIVYATSDLPEYSYWDSAAALARELGAGRTHTLLLGNQGCAPGVDGLFYVAATMAAQPELETALLVVVNRVSEFHRNRMNVINSVLSDGAAAVVLRRGHPANRWLATEKFTDPEYCDMLRLDFGGTVTPLPPPDWSSRTAPSGYVGINAHFGGDSARLGRFLVDRVDRIREVVEGACKRAGISIGDVAHMIYLHDSPAAIAAMARPLGIPLHRTNAGIAPEHGHIGAADQLVSLGLHLERGDLKPGEVVALCGISTGMQWACTLVQI